MMEKKTTSATQLTKLRHSTGAYLHMHDAPTEEDMIYFLKSQKHKSAEIPAMIKVFGEHKADQIESILRMLNAQRIIQRSGEQNQVAILIKA